MLYYKKTTLQGAAAGMVFGFATTIIWVLGYKAATYDLYELIPGLIVGFGVTWLVSLMTYNRVSSSEPQSK
jgi:Na+/proline symporter